MQLSWTFILRFPLLFKRFFWAEFRSSISELSMGKMFNCTPSWSSKEVLILMVLRLILKAILKTYFRLISSMLKSQSSFGKFVIKYKIELKLFLFLTSGTQNISCIAHSVYCKERFLSQISGLRIWFPSRNFGHEINLKGLLYLGLLDWRLR